MLPALMCGDGDGKVLCAQSLPCSCAGIGCIPQMLLRGFHHSCTSCKLSRHCQNPALRSTFTISHMAPIESGRDTIMHLAKGLQVFTVLGRQRVLVGLKGPCCVLSPFQEPWQRIIHHV